MAEEHLYYLQYEITPIPEGFTKSQVPPGHGACDAILLVSILHTAEGGVSYAFVGADGKEKRDLTPTEMFKIWAVLAHELSEMPDLGEGRKQLASMVHETIKTAIMDARSMTHGDPA